MQNIYISFMLIFYRIALLVYWLTIRLISPFHRKARLFSKGRKDWKRNLENIFSKNHLPVIWIHAASLGEFEQGRPIMESLKKQQPDYKILLTFFSPSGFEIRKKYEYADWIIYMPIDFPSNAHFFVKTVNPKLTIFIKYEYWYYFLRELNRKKKSILVISTRFRKNQLFFHPLGGFYRQALQWIDFFFLQDENSKYLVEKIGIKQTKIAGDTRFDRVIKIANEIGELEIINKFKDQERVVVIGSSWNSDMVHLNPFIQQFSKNFKFIIAPHNINEKEINTLRNKLQDTILYSELKSEMVNLSARVLIIDNMGMLSSIYRYADFAIIGGAFRGALHNTLEAAVYGIPILFGSHPKNQKFKEAIDLINIGGAFTFSDTQNLIRTVEALLLKPQYERACEVAGTYVQHKSGATEKIMNYINKILN